jgi:CRP-like cAMP-binding protein
VTLDTSTSPLFSALDPVERAELLTHFRIRTYSKGQWVFHDGDRGDALHLVYSGRFEVVATTGTGHAIAFRVMHPGEVMGELALVHPSSRRTGGVRALEASVTLALHRRDFEQARLRHPSIDRFLVMVLAERLVRTSELAVELLMPPEVRLWRRLSVLAEAYGDEPITMTQDTLAHAAGTVRQTANRVVNEGVRLGALEATRGSLRVLDRELVLRLAGHDTPR